MKQIGLEIMYEGGTYTYNTAEYSELLDVLQCGILSLCGCGLPEDNIKFIKEGLQLIQERIDTDISYNDWNKKCIEFFGNEASMNFFFYYTEAMQFTEHGSSVPGWLTHSGKEFIKLAEIALGDNEFDIFEDETYSIYNLISEAE